MNFFTVIITKLQKLNLSGKFVQGFLSDLRQRNSCSHVLKAGVILHTAICCQAAQAWTECSPGQVQP